MRASELRTLRRSPFLVTFVEGREWRGKHRDRVDPEKSAAAVESRGDGGMSFQRAAGSPPAVCRTTEEGIRGYCCEGYKSCSSRDRCVREGLGLVDNRLGLHITTWPWVDLSLRRSSPSISLGGRSVSGDPEEVQRKKWLVWSSKQHSDLTTRSRRSFGVNRVGTGGRYCLGMLCAYCSL